MSGPVGQIVVSKLGANFTVTPRTATPVVSGTPITFTQATGYDTQLYSFSPSALPALARLTVATGNASARPRLTVLGDSGHWNDFLAAGRVNNAILKSGKVYAIYSDP